MRRSSLIAICIALSLLAAALVALSIPATSSAPPVDTRMAQRILDQGKSALERKDVEAILSLFSGDATILGLSRGQIRRVLEQTMRELGDDSLTVSFSKLEVASAQSGPLVSVNLDVSQRFRNADASYFRPRLHLVLARHEVPWMLGLFKREEWRIRQLDADPPFQLPFRPRR